MTFYRMNLNLVLFLFKKELNLLSPSLLTSKLNFLTYPEE
jgi:hypothetical protein